MNRLTVTAVAAFALISTGAVLAEPPTEPGSPPPSDSSHAPKQPEAKTPTTPKPAEAKPAEAKPVVKATEEGGKKPWVSEWRKAYVAKHGHEPGASADKSAAGKKAAKPLPKYKRCT